MPSIYDASIAFKAALATRQQRQSLQMATHWLTLMNGVEDDIEALAAIVHRRYTHDNPPTQAQLFRIARYRKLKKDMAVQLAEYAEWAASDVTLEQVSFGTMGVEHASATLEIADPGVAATFARLPVAQIEAAAGFASDSSPLIDVFMSAMIPTDEGAKILIEGVARGYNPRKTARLMVQNFRTPLNKALMIARTETMRPYRSTTQQTYKDSGVVTGYQRVATRDARTCMGCLMADGDFYPLDVGFESHPQCRCTLIPLVKGAPKPVWTHGENWFLSRTPEQQRAQMGPKFYEAWQDGQFELDDMIKVTPNATWGDALGTKPLHELV